MQDEMRVPGRAAARTRRGTAALHLTLAAALALAPVGTPALAQQAEPRPAAAPSPTAWLDALAAVGREPRAYHGSVGARSLHVGLSLPGPDGGLTGTAVLLDPANHVVAAGPVRGRITAHDCHLRLELGDVTARLAGACRPATLSGTLDEERRQPFNLIRFLYAKGAEHVLGEVWLTAGP